MTTLTERLEAATEGSRELDGEIFFATVRPDLEPDVREFADRLGISMATSNARNRGPEIPHYTTSLDAALTLVPEGCEVEGLMSTFNRSRLEIHSPTKLDAISKGWAATRALALCIAALKARGL